ncbi:MAG: aldehyde ferredoxin oxidoreductase family protein [Chloroflexota bacterium]
MAVAGYLGKLLKVDLSEGRIWTEDLDEVTLKTWVGGVGLGAKYLFDEVPPGVESFDPENRLIWTTGPLAGTGVSGAATFNVVSKGPMTNHAGSTQANGFFGAYLKFSGFDGIIFQGAAPHPVYLWIHDGQAELRDARALWGLTVWEVEDRVREELQARERDVSVYAIGPAGESRAFYATIVGDRGHVVAHNGLGAVMGSKNLKAVVAYDGGLRRGFEVADPDELKASDDEMFEFARGFGVIYQWGTGGGFSGLYGIGALPVKNYTTNLYPEHERMNGQYLRTHFEVKPMPCFKCRVAHVKEVTVTEGPYAGFVGEEPEYEQLAAWGPAIGNSDLGATVVLARDVDTLGLDCNEAAWAIGWAMECYEKGVFTQRETDGIDLRWGNVEAARELLNRIARRQGYLGELLADGVMRASRHVGGEAADWAIYTEKGVAPRSHDHRGRWIELFDSCISNTGTLESSWGGIHTQLVDLPSHTAPFSHEEVSTLLARFNGIRQFDDCLGICRLATPNPKLLMRAFNALTGWGWTLEDAFTVGRRVVNLLRLYNFEHGMKTEDEWPSTRYGSVPVDGPAEGRDILARWPWMLQNYYRLMGWDEKTGKPLPETLEKLGLGYLAAER